MPKTSIDAREFLACPQCGGMLLARGGSSFECTPCHAAFPILGGLPWLLPHADSVVQQWRQHLHTHLLTFARDAEQIKTELRSDALSPTTKKRLQKILQAIVEQGRYFQQIMSPIDIPAAGDLETSLALKTKLPLSQGLSGYIHNLFRDWNWNNGENETGLACLEAVKSVDLSGKDVLVLGAGSGRLAYDLHRQWGVGATVCCDINPLLTYAAEKIMRQHRTLKLYEFPLAPTSLDHTCVLRKCAAPAQIDGGIHFVFGDIQNPPFQPGCFDAVVTPWFIDILPQDPLETFQSVNRLLKPEGVHLNFGTYHFEARAFSKRWSPEELRELLIDAGLKLERESFARIPYLQSPISCFGRVEHTWSWSARKISEVKPRSAGAKHYLPTWLTDTDEPVPKLESFTSFAKMQSVFVDLIQCIDGERSLRAIADVFAQDHGLPVETAVPTIQRFLTQLYEESLRPA